MRPGFFDDAEDEDVQLDQRDLLSRNGFSTFSVSEKQMLFGPETGLRLFKRGLKLNGGKLTKAGQLLAAGYGNFQTSLLVPCHHKVAQKLRKALKAVSGRDLKITKVIRKGHPIDLTGLRFSRWLVVSRCAVNAKHNRTRWYCVCNCGVKKIVAGKELRLGRSRSCGCLRAELAKARGTKYPTVEAKRAAAGARRRRWLRCAIDSLNPTYVKALIARNLGIRAAEVSNVAIELKTKQLLMRRK